MKPGVGSSFLTSAAGISDFKAVEAVNFKLASLIESCQRLRVENAEALSWCGLLSDFIALTTALHMLRNAASTATLNSRCILPRDVPCEINEVFGIPDALATFPGDDASDEIAALLAESNIAITANAPGGTAAAGPPQAPAVVGATPAFMNASIPGLDTAQDIKRFKIELQKFNRCVDSLYERFDSKSQQALEQSKSKLEALISGTPGELGLQPPSAHQLRKDCELLANMLETFYQNSNLRPPKI